MKRVELSITIPGRPVPQPKPRTKGNLRFYPKTYTDYRDGAAEIAQIEAARLHRLGRSWPAGLDAYGIELWYHVPDFRSTDLDRLTATMLDAMAHAGMYENDRLVCDMAVHRRLDPDNPRVELTLHCDVL